MLSDGEQSAVREAISRVRQKASVRLKVRRTAPAALGFVAVLHESVDKAIHQETAHGPTPECRVGCSHCCHLQVEATEPEALWIAQYLQTHRADELGRLTQRLQEKAKHHGGRPISPAVPRMACAFLEDQKCTIYAVRPATCRKAHSLSVRACETGAAEIPQSLSILLQSEVLITGTSQAFQESNLACAKHELSVAVLAAMSSPNAVQAWFQGNGLVDSPSRPGRPDCQ